MVHGDFLRQFLRSLPLVIEQRRQLRDGYLEFTMRRLRAADSNPAEDRRPIENPQGCRPIRVGMTAPPILERYPSEHCWRVALLAYRGWLTTIF